MRDIELRLTADLDGATKEVAGFKKEFAEMVKVVEKPLRQVNSYRELESTIEKTGNATREARERIRELSNEIARSDAPSKQLQESYKASVRELQRLERVEATQTLQLGQMRSSLRAAGIDTRNLASEQSRLSAEYNKAFSAGRANSALSSAKSSLGAGAVRDTQLELVKLREQYALVRSSGEVSARDLAIAQANYRRSVNETLQKLRELRSASAASSKAQTAPALDRSRQTFGINQLHELRNQLLFLTADYQRLTRSGVLSSTERAVAENRYRQQVEQTRRSIAALTNQQESRPKSTGAGRGTGIAENVTLAGAGLSALAVSAAYLKATDTAKKMDAQLKLATNSQAEFNEAQRALFVIAQRNQAPLEGVVSLYGQLAPALAQMGRGQQDTLGVIDAVTKSLRISGATASETASTVLQFSQALGSGVLRGDEFNSIAENSPRLLRALAEGLKVPTGALRALAAEGKLTADVIVDTLLGQLPKLSEEAKSLPDTWGGAFEQLKNQLLVATKQLDDFTGASSSAVEMVHGLTSAIARLSNGEFGDFFRSTKLSVGGFNNDISVALARIRDLTAARSRLDQNNPSDTTFFNWKFYSQADFDKEIKSLQLFISDSRKAADNLLADQGQSNTEADKLAEDRASSAREQSNRLKAIQSDLLDATKKGIKSQVAAERQATAELKKAKAEQLETQKKYSQALSDIQGGGSAAEPSYGAAQALKVGAKQALASGDVEGAKSKAEASLDILKQLADAGGNTLGFAGFIKELQGIATAADGISVKKAEDSLQAATDKTADLKSRLDDLKNVQITPTLSDEAVAAVLKQMQDLKVKLGLAFEVPVQLKPTQEMQVISGQYVNPLSFPDPSKATYNAATEKMASAAPVNTLKYQAGVTDYSQQSVQAQPAPVPVPVKPAIDQGALDRANALVEAAADEYRKRLTIPVAVDPETVQVAAEQLAVPVSPSVDDASVAAAQSHIAAVADQMRKTLTIPVTVVGDGSAALNAPTSELPAYARGDMVRGPGTGTSDSILAKVSNGEFIMRTAAVRHYGPEFLRLINQKQLPKFAVGGLVGPHLPDIPSPSQAIINQLNPAPVQPFASVALSVGGETYHVQAPQPEFERIVRNQRLKFGKS
jgi:tape measure domain-containing protein